MAATKRNAGLTSAVPRATLNDEELVINPNFRINIIYNGNWMNFSENARIQKSLTSTYLSNFINNTTQLRSMDSHESGNFIENGIFKNEPILYYFVPL